MINEKKSEDLVLGGNIVLSGFKEIGKGENVIVKKIVGSYTRKLSENIEGFENIKVTLKIIHKTEASEKYEIHVNVMVNSKPITSETTDRNLFVALDEVLKKVEILAKKS